MTHISFLILAVVVLTLPMLNTSTRAYALARYGFSRWFWATLPAGSIGGFLLSRVFSDLNDFAQLGLIFHVQWALLITMFRFFVRKEGREPRDAYMRGWDELPYDAPDRLFQFVSTIVMFLTGAGLLFVPRPYVG